VIMTTGSPQQLRAVRELVERVVEGATEQKLIPFDLTFVTAPEARQQALELVGLLDGDTQRTMQPGRGDQQQQIQPGAGSGSLSNLASKLIVARSGNTLMFKGTDMEAQRVAELLSLIDRPNNLQPKQYFTGTQTSAVAQFAETRGLGTVVRVSQADFSQQGQLQRQQRELQQQMLGAMGGETQSVGGSLLVADEERGRIVYYGTPEQHAELEALVDQIGAEAEQVVMRAYRLNWADAEAVAEIVTGLIERRQPAVDGPLASRGFGQQQ